ncbi:MAG: hypothetical protein AAGI72_21760 [Pseudomonadota bacterium]
MGEDKLTITIEIVEVHCGSSGKPMEVCDEADVAFRSNMMRKAINDVLQLATSRSSIQILTSAGRSVDHEQPVPGGTMKVELEVSDVENRQVLIDVSYRIEMDDDQSTEGFTQVLSTLDDEPFPISGGTTTFKSDETDQIDKVVRVVLLKARPS